MGTIIHMLNLQLFCLLLGPAFIFAAVFYKTNDLSTSHWTYTHQNHWKADHPDCGGRQQSPINIDPSKVQANPKMKLTFKGYQNPQKNFSILNNGHTLVFSYMGPPNEAPSVGGPALRGKKFILAQFHFHWGQNPGVGSEHTINGKPYDLELHLVHYNHAKYGSFGKALNAKADGVVVLGIMFKVTADNQPRLDALIQGINQMAVKGKEGKSPFQPSEPLWLEDFLPPADSLFADNSIDDSDAIEYYRYGGSLTTPPCTEGIIWLLVSQPALIGQQQIEAFRAFSKVGNNYREVQKQNGRQILISKL